MSSKSDKKKKKNKNKTNKVHETITNTNNESIVEEKIIKPILYELTYPVSTLPKTVDKNNNIKDDVLYLDYEDESQLSTIQQMAAKDLSEPYSIFTYRYFLLKWPELCICAYSNTNTNTDSDGIKKKGPMIGTILCKIDIAEEYGEYMRRGYIAMLIVDKSQRKRGIGLKLSMLAIERMIQYKCDQIILETEACNTTALSLYEKLGFSREELLPR